MKNRLMTFQDIVTRYRRGENLFDITIDKWTGIKDSFHDVEQLSELAPIIRSARSGGAFCLEYQESCLICPLERWCRDQEGTYQTIVKLMYLYASSGHQEFKNQTIRHIDKIFRGVGRIQGGVSAEAQLRCLIGTRSSPCASCSPTSCNTA